MGCCFSAGKSGILSATKKTLCNALGHGKVAKNAPSFHQLLILVKLEEKGYRNRFGKWNKLAGTTHTLGVSSPAYPALEE